MKIVTFSEAATQLDSLATLAFQGESILIVKGSKLLSLQAIPSIPARPPGYFDDIYNEEYIRELNKLTEHSVFSIPPDLE